MIKLTMEIKIREEYVCLLELYKILITSEVIRIKRRVLNMYFYNIYMREGQKNNERSKGV